MLPPCSSESRVGCAETLRVRALDSACARRAKGWLGVLDPRLITALIFAIVDPIYAIILGGIRTFEPTGVRAAAIAGRQGAAIRRRPPGGEPSTLGFGGRYAKLALHLWRRRPTDPLRRSGRIHHGAYAARWGGAFVIHWADLRRRHGVPIARMAVRDGERSEARSTPGAATQESGASLGRVVPGPLAQSVATCWR
jgi:hypothetical protein